MRLTILSRASDLARIQADAVADALRRRWPDLDVVLTTRRSAGDRDDTTPLAQFADKGAFTADLSEALVNGDADLVVHSWKDLPLENAPGTIIAGTLPRADPRDVLVVRRQAVERSQPVLRVLTSSPRRAWLLERSLAPLLSWRVDAIEALPVRGNVPTRLKKLVAGSADALVVAKAALDRLLASSDAARLVRDPLRECRWMVLPIRDFPGAPAQGALAIEVAAGNRDALARVEAITDTKTMKAVERERAYLASHGGGCHAPIAATVLPREYGVVTSALAKTDRGVEQIWSLETLREPATASAATMFPRPDERDRAVRRLLDVAAPPAGRPLWIARAEALHESWPLDADRLIWTAGTRTWQRLAARGVWVNGCADGLGDGEVPSLDLLAGRACDWLRLTHSAVDDDDALATYTVSSERPSDLGDRTHFFWTSGTEFRQALREFPTLATRHHACGPGRTAIAIREQLGDEAAHVWLDYDAWYRDVCR